MIKLDINIGDHILVGRFKNKRIEVKEIGVDEHGGPTVNGRSILKIRIEKLMEPKNKSVKEAILNKSWKQLIGKSVTLIDTLIVTDYKTNKNIKLNPGDIVKIIDSARANSNIKDDVAFIEFKGKIYVSTPEPLLNKSNLNEENMKTKKNLKESFSNELENLKDQFEKLKYYTKINSDGSISAYYNKFNPDRLTISVSDHPDHPAGRFYLYILYKVEVNSRSLADPTAAYQTTSARIVKHSTKKIRKYYDDFAKVIASINKVLSANNFTLLNYSDIKESKQFKLANIAKKILKENSNEVDQLFKFLDHPWQEDGEIEFVSLLDQNRGNFKTSNWAATLRYLRSMDKANSNLSMMASDKFLTMWDDLIK